MTNLVTPTIHSNGTDGNELLSSVQAITASLSHVQDAMRAAMPNGRDYYPQGSEAASEARTAFVERRTIIWEMLKEFEDLELAIYAQNEARAERSAA